jgi:choline dehydrogenase-like flavoprotein
VRVVESDVCIIGAGICGVLLAEKVKRAKPDAIVALVEAGRDMSDTDRRMQYRQRLLDYNESAWPGDYVDDQLVLNGESQTMAVGGWALHWEGGCPRFSEEDLRLKSLYGFGEDWPIAWQEMEQRYCEAERAIGVSGDPSPYPEDRQSAPYPMPGMPLSHTLQQVRSWVEASDLRTSVMPAARNTQEYGGRPTCSRCDTCTPICPIGARYSPDYTVREMQRAKQIDLHANTLIRRLILDPSSDRIVAATGVRTDSRETPVEFRARQFVLALGKYWTPQLLLISASPRFRNGLANRSGLVGKYMSGTNTMSARIQIDRPLVHGMHDTNALVSRKHFRCAANRRYIRHDTRFTTHLDRPRLRDDRGQIAIGDALFKRWREFERDTVGVTIRFAQHAARESGIVLDATRTNRWGDPLPQFGQLLDPATTRHHSDLAAHFEQLCKNLITVGGGKIQWMNYGESTDSIWRSGGCRMSDNASHGVCDSFGRTFDHENLYIVGAPTLPNPGIGSETLAFVALTLRSAEEVVRTL